MWRLLRRIWHEFTRVVPCLDCREAMASGRELLHCHACPCCKGQPRW